MDRRHFLASLMGGTIAAHELDIDKLLWVPGRKTIFIPQASDCAEVFIESLWWIESPASIVITKRVTISERPPGLSFRGIPVSFSDEFL